MSEWKHLHEAVEALKKQSTEELCFPERLAGAFARMGGVRVLLNDYIPANVVMIGTGRKCLDRWNEFGCKKVTDD